MAEKAQKKAGNPYAPTDSAGGTPTDNQADESMALPPSPVLHYHSALLPPMALHISLSLHRQAFCPAWFDPYTACCFLKHTQLSACVMSCHDRDLAGVVCRA